MTDVKTLEQEVHQQFSGLTLNTVVALGDLTVEVAAEDLRELCFGLHDKAQFKFELLMDVCGVDYQDYGIAEWATHETTTTGFSRGVEKDPSKHYTPWNKPRFAAVYHLLSLSHNHRIRVRAFADEETLILPSVIDIWNSANWFEREAFDLYGIIFEGHPDLRRILTDYGFIGHPFRKDFPLIGTVEPRYDAALNRVVYEPVSIEPRTLVPKIIREDNRYVKRAEAIAAGAPSQAEHKEDK